MSKVVYFELHAPDPDAAMRHYERTFGWKFSLFGEEKNYWTISTGAGDGGIDGGLMRSEDGAPRAVITMQVDSIDEQLRRVVENGGTITEPKMQIPGVGWIAYCTDPGGLMYALYQPDSMD